MSDSTAEASRAGETGMSLSELVALVISLSAVLGITVVFVGPALLAPTAPAEVGAAAPESAHPHPLTLVTDYPLALLVFLIPVVVAGVATARWMRGRPADECEAAARRFTVGAGVLLSLTLPIVLSALADRVGPSTDRTSPGGTPVAVVGALAVSGAAALLLRREPVLRVVLALLAVAAGAVVHAVEPFSVVVTPYTGAVAGLLVGAVVVSPRRGRATSAGEPASVP